jgi:alpha-beta hydrolase superfamily lysophospholipase
LRAGTQKEILWAHSDRRRTEISLIYLHGFSASRREVAPLAEQVAGALQANLYYTRLSGHGRSPEAMAEASLQAWLDDTLEAMVIGERIGRRVVILATSTGATLATWLATQRDRGPLFANILISPNYGPRRWQARLLTWPWAKYFVPLLQGPNYSWTPRNADHGRYWTAQFPTRALFPMAATVELVEKADPAGVDVPTIIFYSRQDRVVDSSRIERFYQRLTVSPRALVPVEDTGDPDYHVLAGDVLSPGTTERLAEQIVAFVRRAE